MDHGQPIEGSVDLDLHRQFAIPWNAGKPEIGTTVRSDDGGGTAAIDNERGRFPIHKRIHTQMILARTLQW